MPYLCHDSQATTSIFFAVRKKCGSLITRQIGSEAVRIERAAVEELVRAEQ